MNTNPANKIQPKDILDFFIDQRRETTELRDAMNLHLLELRNDVIKQKRELFKYLIVPSGIILGLSSSAGKELLSSPYYIIGIILQILVISFVLLYSRETLDRDGQGLIIEQDRYNGLLEDKMALVDKYLSVADFSQRALEKYNTDLRSLSSVEALKEANRQLTEQRINRHKESLDFSCEIVLFLLITGTALILFPVIQYQPTPFFLASLILLIFGLAFSDSWSWFAKPISRFAQFLRYKLW